MAHPWTTDEVSYLRANWATVRTADLAKHLGRSDDSVFGKARILGLPPRRLPLARSPEPEQLRWTAVRPQIQAPPEKKTPIHPLMAVGANECRWPLGHPGQPGFHFCRLPVATVGRPYCGEHTSMAYHYPLSRPRVDASMDKLDAG